MKKSISVNFDGTLTLHWVQDYIRELMQDGISVYIVTSRYNDLLRQMAQASSNDDLFALADELNIPHRNVIFTNRTDKSYVLGGSEIVFHLDDDINVVNEINRYSDVKAIGLYQSDWKEQCQSLLI